MKRIMNDTVSKDSLNDYLCIRAKQYLEKPDKEKNAGAEAEFYSNIMEIVSLMDYCYVPVSLTNLNLIRSVRAIHYKIITK